MSKRAMVTMARRNPVTERMLWIAGLAVGGAALVGGVVYAATRPAPTAGGAATPGPTAGPTSSPTPVSTSAPNTVPSVLKQGERYQITAAAPAGTLGAYGTQSTMQSAIDQIAPGQFKIASLTVSGTNVVVVVDVVGPDYTVPALVTADVAAVLARGISFTVADMGPTPAGAAVPSLLVSGPYNQVSQMQVGETYLVSLSPIAGQTLASTVQNLTTSSAQSSAQYTVSQSWDVGQIPAGWPSQDQGSNEWRMVITYASGSGPQSPSGFNIFTTAGATA